MNAVALLSAQLPEPVRLRDGSVLIIRSMHAGDGPRLCRLYNRLSEDTVYKRFMVAHPILNRASLDYLTDVDHAGREAIVATSNREIIAVARYHVITGKNEAEVAVVVEDRWQKRGIGRMLFDRIADLARLRGVGALSGTMLADNRGATRLLLSGFPDAERKISQGELMFRAPLLPAAPTRPALVRP